jgi:hypothetical protein
MFQGSGQQMTIFGLFTSLVLIYADLINPCVGFEYWADPNNRDDGFITWVSDGQPSVRMGPSAVGPDMGDGGSQVGQRLIPEEPMVRTFFHILVRGSRPDCRRSFSTWVYQVRSSFQFVRIPLILPLQQTGKRFSSRQWNSPPKC